MEVVNPPHPEKRPLPNASATLVLGILSLTIGCFNIGLILGIIGLVISRDGKLLYDEDPDAYTGYGSLNAGRILCIIAVVLGSISVVIGLLIMLGFATFFGALTGLESWM